jgi:hypothetical protein
MKESDMDHKQLTASIAGAALVAASLFGALAVAQTSTDVAINDNPQTILEPAAASEAAPVALTVEQSGYEAAGEVEASQYEDHRYEGHEDEDHGDEDHDDD